MTLKLVITYYRHGPSAPDAELQERDVQEYGEAFATYVDARRCFQDLKLSRGFLPVVALSETNSSSSSCQQPGQHSGGKPGGGFSKGRGKKGNGKNIVKYKPSPGKGVNPKGRAHAAITHVCIRCGAEGHKAITCPKQKTSVPTSSNKRQAVESVAMHGDEKEISSSFLLMGYGPFVRYVQRLRQLGFSVEKIEIYKCRRTFHFGGDNSSVCTFAVKLPVFAGGQYGLLQRYLLKGGTPLLLGRPIAQALGLKLDLRESRLSTWRPILLGLHGEYLLPLTQGYSNEYNLEKPSFNSMSAEFLEAEKTEVMHLHEFAAMENLAMTAEDEPADGSCPISNRLWKTCSNALEASQNELQAMITRELHPAEHRKRKFWEVYTGSSRLSEVAETLNMDVQRFGPETGWDFNRRDHQL